MKRIIFCLIILSFSFILVAQTQNVTTKDNLKDMKILRNEEVDNVQIDVAKPDQSAYLPKKNRELGIYPKLEIESRIKKSNKLLY